MSKFLVGGKDGLGAQILAPGDVGHVLFENGRMYLILNAAGKDRILFRDPKVGRPAETLCCPTGLPPESTREEPDVESERTRVEFVADLLGAAADLHVDFRMVEPNAWELVFGAKP